MEQLAARQAEVRAGRDSREGAMLDYLEDMAFAWRQLQSYTDKRTKLELMRKQVGPGGGGGGWGSGRGQEQSPGSCPAPLGSPA
jgi:hypothetical protein